MENQQLKQTGKFAHFIVVTDSKSHVVRRRYNLYRRVQTVMKKAVAGKPVNHGVVFLPKGKRVLNNPRPSSKILGHTGNKRSRDEDILDSQSSLSSMFSTKSPLNLSPISSISGGGTPQVPLSLSGSLDVTLSPSLSLTQASPPAAEPKKPKYATQRTKRMLELTQDVITNLEAAWDGVHTWSDPAIMKESLSNAIAIAGQLRMHLQGNYMVACMYVAL